MSPGARFSVFDSLVREGPEVGHDARRHGEFHHTLGEKDAGEILARIRIACGADAADPAEPSQYGGTVDALGVDAHAESSARLEPAMAVAKEHLHAFLLRVGQMIHRHERDRRGRKDARAPIHAFAEHHEAEGEIIVGS
jgi:hypothetical protein